MTTLLLCLVLVGLGFLALFYLMREAESGLTHDEWSN